MTSSSERTQILNETLPALRDLQKQGKTRFIGITSYQLRLMAEIAETEPVDSVLSYCRFNLLVDDLNTILLPVVKKLGIGLINASPLHMGLLAGNGTPPWHPANSDLKQAATSFKALCLAGGVEPAQVALRYCLDHPYAASTLMGMSTIEQVASNVECLDMKIDDEFRRRVELLFKPLKNFVWPSGLPQNADYQLAANQC